MPLLALRWISYGFIASASIGGRRLMIEFDIVTSIAEQPALIARAIIEEIIDAASDIGDTMSKLLIIGIFYTYQSISIEVALIHLVGKGMTVLICTCRWVFLMAYLCGRAGSSCHARCDVRLGGKYRSAWHDGFMRSPLLLMGPDAADAYLVGIDSLGLRGPMTNKIRYFYSSINISADWLADGHQKTSISYAAATSRCDLSEWRIILGKTSPPWQKSLLKMMR